MLVSTSTQGFRGDLAWIKYPKKDMVVTLSYWDSRHAPTQPYYMTAQPYPLVVLMQPSMPPASGGTRSGPAPPPWSGIPTTRTTCRPRGTARAIQTMDIRDLHAGRITTRPAATLAVAQRGAKWVVYPFSQADAHIVICDPPGLPGHEATVPPGNSPCVIVKALKEGKHHALLLQACLKEHAKAAKPGVWPGAALLPIDVEPQLAVPTTAYHWQPALEG